MNKLILNDRIATEWWMDHLTGELDEERTEELLQYLHNKPDLKKELLISELAWTDLTKITSPQPSDAMDSKFESMLLGYIAANERNSAISWLPVLQDWVSRSWRVGLT